MTLIFLVVVIFLTLLKPAYLPGPLARLLRVLVPCWRFFEERGSEYSLHYRPENGPWQRFVAPSRQGLLVNPAGNLFLACQGIVHGLTQQIASLEPGQRPELEEWVDYRLAQNLVRHQVDRGRSVQFKICADGDDILISPPFQA